MPAAIHAPASALRLLITLAIASLAQRAPATERVLFDAADHTPTLTRREADRDGGRLTRTATGTLLWEPDAGNPATAVFVVPASATAGDCLMLACDARAVAPTGGVAGQASFVVGAQLAPTQPGGKPTPLFRHIVLTGEAWETFRLPFRLTSDAVTGALQVVIAPGSFVQPAEIRGLRLLNLGADADPDALFAGAVSYPGQETNAAWRAEAARRIATHRMAEVRVTVTDQFGRAVPGAQVRVQQTRHAYRFGSAVVAGRLVDAPWEFAPETGMTRERFLADNARYRSEFLRLFNTAVLENDLKWTRWTGTHPRRSRQDWTLAALEWLQRQGIVAKGHTLVWASWEMSPAWLRALENQPDQLQAAIRRHIADIGAATASRTAYWDVLNEPMSHRDILDKLGPAAAAEWFKAARAVLPAARLVINEFDLVGNGGDDKRRAGFLELCRTLRELGAPLDVIGAQGHFWSDRLTPPERVWAILDEIHAATGLPVMISEFDMNLPNDRLQAEYTRDLLTAWFAHPATEGFILWGFWGGAHWFGERGAMFRTDWSPKPNLRAYEDLVLRAWWTDATAATDEAGRAALRAFLGDHQLTIMAAGHHPATRTLTLARGGADLTVVLPADNGAGQRTEGPAP